MPHRILTLTDKYQVNLGSFLLLSISLLPRVHQQEHIPIWGNSTYSLSICWKVGELRSLVTKWFLRNTLRQCCKQNWLTNCSCGLRGHLSWCFPRNFSSSTSSWDLQLVCWGTTLPICQQYCKPNFFLFCMFFLHWKNVLISQGLKVWSQKMECILCCPQFLQYLISTVHRKSRQLPGSYSQLDLPVALWWLYRRMVLLGFAMEVYLKASN